MTIAALYLLGIMYFIGQGGFRRVLADTDINEIELLALQRGGKKRLASRMIARADSAANMTDTPSAASEASASASEEGVEGKDAAIAGPLLRGADTVGTQAESRDRAQGAPHSVSSGSTAATRDGAAFRDRFSKQMAAVREFYGLSAREAEVAELIARGNTVAHIAELLLRLREHRAHPFQAHLREAGHPQTSRAHRPRRKLRTRRAIKAGTILNAVRSESR